VQPRDIATFARVFVRTMLDSNRTDDLLTAEELTSVGRMPAVVSLLAASEEGREILRERPRLCSATVDFAALRDLPEGTLGREYAEHLERCGLDPDALTTPVTRSADPLANYLLERVRQTHDIWHTVLGLGVQGHEEVLVHAFQWPQLRMPYSALVVVFGALKHMALEGRLATLRHALGEAVAAGRAAAPLAAIRWERRWQQPLAQVRAELRIRPAAEWRGYMQ
jgi:ubiquinone biosynthesis protein COQ4